MKTALIFHGGWEGHQPRECAALFADRLESRGFQVRSVDTLSCLDDRRSLGAFDLIVPLWTNATLTSDQEKNLTGAVLAGSGLAGFHGGMGDAFRGSINYQWMVGGQFVAHPDNIKSYRVNIVRPQDPIVLGLDDFEVRSEQYYMLVDPRNEVLATSVHQSISAPWTDGVIMPVAWKKMHGAGRVFYSALGHECHEFLEIPAQLELTLRGMVWAARPQAGS